MRCVNRHREIVPASAMRLSASPIAMRPWVYVRAPCMKAVYGARSGPSQLSSMLAPATKVPAAITTGSSYHGMSQGSGVAMLSTGLAA